MSELIEVTPVHTRYSLHPGTLELLDRMPRNFNLAQNSCQFSGHLVGYFQHEIPEEKNLYYAYFALAVSPRIPADCDQRGKYAEVQLFLLENSSDQPPKGVYMRDGRAVTYDRPSIATHDTMSRRIIEQSMAKRLKLDLQHVILHPTVGVIGGVFPAFNQGPAQDALMVMMEPKMRKLLENLGSL